MSQSTDQRFRDALYAIHQVIGATLEINEIMQRVMVEASRVLESDSASVILREGGRWVIKYVHHFPPSLIGQSYSPGEMPHGMRALESRDVVAVPDLLGSNDFTTEQVDPYNVRSVLVLPLLAQQPLGVIFFNYRDPQDDFDPARLTFARELALSVSIALVDARLLAAERQQWKLFEAVVQASPAGIALLDSELRLRLANPAFVQHLANLHHARELKGMRLADLLPAIQSSELLQRMQQVLQTGQSPNETEWGFRNARGEQVHWRCTLNPLPSAEGGVSNLLFQVIDVTEQVTGRKTAEMLAEELQQQAEELEVQAQELQNQNEKLAALTEQLVAERSLLEVRVHDRTAELAASNAALRAEIEERLRAQEQIRKNAERASLLAELSQALAEAGPDHGAVLDVVVRRIANLIGDACVVALLSEDGKTVMPVAYAHTRPEAQALLGEIYAVGATSVHEGLIGRAVQSQEAVLIPDLPPEQMRRALRPEYLGYYEQVGISSALVLPLRTHQRVIGTLGLTRDRGGQSYTPEDQAFLQELADRAALAVANAQLYEQLQATNKSLNAEIAERETAQANLARQAAALREQAALLDLTEDAVIRRDLNARITFWNHGARERYGWTEEEALGQRSHDLFQTIFPKPLTEIYRELLTKGRWEGELSHRRRDGTRLVVAARWALQHDTEGRPIGVLETNNDITAQKEAQAQLAYQAYLLENVTDAVVATDAEQRVTLWNHGAEELLGLGASQVVGRRLRDVVAYDLIGPDHNEVDQLLHTDGRYRGEIRFHRPDGAEIITETTGMALKAEDGQITGYLGVNRDVTARRLAEESLRETLSSLERQSQRLALLHRIDLAVLAARSAREIAQVAADGIRRVVAYQRVDVLLFDPERSKAELVAVSSSGQTALPTGESVSLSAYGLEPELQHGLPSIADLARSRDLPEALAALSAEGIRGFVALPLTVQGRLIGSLNLGSEQAGGSNGDDLELARQAADSLVVAIENVRLYQREQRARQTAEALRAANISLTETLDLQVVLRKLLSVLEPLVPYDFGQVMLVEDKDCLSVRATANRLAKDGETTRSGTANQTVDLKMASPLRDAIANQQGLLVRDTAAHKGWEHMQSLQSAGSWLAVPLTAGGKLVGAFSLATVRPGTFTPEHLLVAQGIAAQAALAIQNAQLFTQVVTGRRHLRALSRRLVQVQEAERRSIARELHDEAGQALTSLLLGLGSIEREAHQPVAVINMAHKMKEVTSATMEGLHRLAANLRPVSLDRLGLVPALQQYVEDFERQYGVEADMVAFGFDEATPGSDGIDKSLPPEVQTALYRVVQEALTNVARHAKARQVGIILERHDNRVSAIVEDDGVGFDLDEARLRGRLGVFGMQERAEMLGGKFLVESAEGKGTTVFVEIPLNELAAGDTL